MDVGITGGSMLVRLGRAEEVMDFFERIRAVCSPMSEVDALIIDRLYRRYLRQTELQLATELLSSLSGRLGYDANAKQLNFQQRFSSAFDRCAESASLNFEAFKDTNDYQYEPVRLVIADLRWFTAEKARSLDQYDGLHGAPFWYVR